MPEVVVVGGGIAGAALATVLARDGRDVLVLERETVFRDKVRGEVVLPWGAAEALRLGLVGTLLGAGGTWLTRGVFHDEAYPAPLQRQMADLLPGVPGMLAVGHPEACEALLSGAAACGAAVLRGVRGIEVRPGPSPEVRYVHAGAERVVACRLVVGADGRKSPVRRRLGMWLHETEPLTMLGGLLVDGLHAWPSGLSSLGTEGDLYHLVFPRQAGRARLYLVHDVRQRGRFAGPAAAEQFLAAARSRSCPGEGMFADAVPAGPCAFFPMTDTWTTEPYAPGVVLVGDAAGWSDPVIGQGLSVAFRDVRTVAEILRGTDDWSARSFRPYGEERGERMRRLRVAAAVVTDLQASFDAPTIARRRKFASYLGVDPVLTGARMAILVGPEKFPAEAFTPAVLERIRSLK